MSTLPTRPPLFEARDLGKRYPAAGGKTVRALDGASFVLPRGSLVALVGESGSGKSTLAKLLVGMETPTSGELRFAGGREGARVQMVFQDPFAALNPVHTIVHHVERPLRLRGVARPRAEAIALLETVGLSADFAMRKPHELSGGQRQRVVLARALAADPAILVADEPTSMLDVSLRAEILDLLVRLKKERGLAILLVTHDLASARAVADRILVLYAGSIVEEGPAEVVATDPQHPYTRLLVAAARHGCIRAPLPAKSGMPDLVNPPRGCAFAPRCDVADRACTEIAPRNYSVYGRRVRCHRSAN